MKEIRVLIVGCGRMGRLVAEACAAAEGVCLVGGVDPFLPNGLDFPIWPDFASVTAKADVVIDFSNPKLLEDLLCFVKQNNLPLVSCTTGYSAAQMDAVTAAACTLPVFRSANMSVGVWLLNRLVKQAAAALGEDFDIELIEKHHHSKVDAPSGTALTLLESVQSALDTPYEVVTDRTTRRLARPKKEIGVSCVRGGSIAGDHELLFAGSNEIVSLSHRADSPMIFATGAVRAALFLVQKPAGLYDMDHLMEARMQTAL